MRTNVMLALLLYPLAFLAQGQRMKMKLMTWMTLLLSALLSPIAALAQTDDATVTVKPMVGMTVTTLAGDNTSDIRSGAGWAVGMEGEVRLSERIGLSLGLVYTKNTFKSVETMTDGAPSTLLFRSFSNNRFSQEHIQTPLMIAFYPVKHLALKAGIQPRLLLSATWQTHVSGDYADMSGVGYAPVIIEDLPRTHFDYDQTSQVRATFDKVGLSIPVGVSYEWKRVVLDARYHFGLSDEAESGDKERYLMLTLGYKFNM